MRIFIISLVFFLVYPALSFGHSGKAGHHVIIDTDGALDDLRAIHMLLASNDVEILGVTCCSGILSPEEAAVKVAGLLDHFGRHGIPVGKGRVGVLPDYPCRPVAAGLHWGKMTRQDEFSDAVVLWHQLIAEEAEEVTLICLGPLSNLADYLKGHPGQGEMPDRVLWFSSSGAGPGGTNWNLAMEDAEFVIHSGMPLEIISNGEYQEPLPFSPQMIGRMDTMDSRYASHLADLMQEGAAMDLVENNVTRIADELVVLYLLDSIMFNTELTTKHVLLASVKEPGMISDALCFRLQEKPLDGKVIRSLPEAAAYYVSDFAEVKDDILRLHGPEEYRTGVLTQELHGHLGVYAIIGTKMGIRAREYFGIGVDDMHVVSYAGVRPPVSCMNDGLQVSTGATLGHGLIRVDTAGIQRPEAEFTFRSQTIRITLKVPFGEKLKHAIREGVEQYGLESESYWNYIRGLAIECWRDWSRSEIFEITRVAAMVRSERYSGEKTKPQ
ncbi:MAG: nucleoside hydrolase [Bacteroidales bacterium]|nr:nucleoside hydrolase [Bacteroidales bacterium]